MSMMRHWHFFHKETGLFSDATHGGSTDQYLVSNTPGSHVAIEGRFDAESQRVDIATGQIIGYRPPQPSDEHEWNAATKRWQLTQEVQQRNAARASAQQQIAALEAQQHRRVRELLAMNDPQLKAIDDRIAEHRKVISKTDTSAG